VFQTPITDNLSGLSNGDTLRMSRWIFDQFSLVVCRGDNFIAPCDNGANRNVTFSRG
jgi:hypothetical protein